ncbi:MAG TPA: NAD(P)H-binding protein, partial [Pseudonocardiaceae bacterium]|nr:NAD(P)H-binding protein [Pseudonocardiaceae bacterium]
MTGATGDVGRRVAADLVRAGRVVRVLVRDPERAPVGVDVVQGDLTDPASLAAAAKGVDAVFLILVDGGAAAIHHALAGVGHVVVLSGRYATEEVDNPLRAKYVDGEAAVSAPATLLRPNAFASLARLWAPAVRTTGTVTTPFPELALPVIHPHDVADAATAALIGDGHVGHAYDLSGPTALTVRERVAVIAAVTGRALRVERVGLEEYVARLDPFARAVTELDRYVAEHPPTVVPTVSRILGRPARTFRDWAAEHAAEFMPG